MGEKVKCETICEWYDGESDYEREPFCGFNGDYHPEECPINLDNCPFFKEEKK